MQQLNLEQAKDGFVATWGNLGVEWGINRTMAQIHALLLISEDALSTDEVMERLQISRGNANMNLRALVDWGLLRREMRTGERKDLFVAEKDLWQVARIIARERQKRELEPLMRSLERLLEVREGKNDQDEVKRFRKTVTDIVDLGKKANMLLALVLKLDKETFFRPIRRLFGG